VRHHEPRAKDIFFGIAKGIDTLLRRTILVKKIRQKRLKSSVFRPIQHKGGLFC
jgi:hypothetical protein